MGISAKNKALVRAVFLDRDGVLNENVLNPETREWESPHAIKDFHLFKETLPALKRLQNAGFLLFVISNQPSYAKGKVSLEALQAIHGHFEQILKANGIKIKKSYYCYHHPKGEVPEYSIVCECRKPKPFFIRKAEQDFNLSLEESWMLGDRDTDIKCGKSAGVKTILIKSNVQNAATCTDQDFTTLGISSAVDIILKIKEIIKRRVV